jgi:hypothetical protein
MHYRDHSNLKFRPPGISDSVNWIPQEPKGQCSSSVGYCPCAHASSTKIALRNQYQAMKKVRNTVRDLVERKIEHTLAFVRCRCNTVGSAHAKEVQRKRCENNTRTMRERCHGNATRLDRKCHFSYYVITGLSYFAQLSSCWGLVSLQE